MLNGNKSTSSTIPSPFPETETRQDKHLPTSLEKELSFILLFFRRDRQKCHSQSDIYRHHIHSHTCTMTWDLPAEQENKLIKSDRSSNQYTKRSANITCPPPPNCLINGSKVCNILCQHLHEWAQARSPVILVNVGWFEIRGHIA